MQQQEEHQLANSSDSTLYDRHAATILAYARSHTASWQDAEDLTLEVFLVALEHDNLSWLPTKQQLAWLWRATSSKASRSWPDEAHRRIPIPPPPAVLFSMTG